MLISQFQLNFGIKINRNCVLTINQYSMPSSTLYKLPEDTVSIASDKAVTYGENLNELPEQLSHIQKSIDDSAFIAALSDNWDDEGGIGISIELYNATISFLKRYALCVFKTMGEVIAEPDIVPVKDGTIDLEWHTSKARMLVNMKSNGIAAYYGDNLNSINSIKGKVATDGVELFLASWMTKLGI